MFMYAYSVCYVSTLLFEMVCTYVTIPRIQGCQIYIQIKTSPSAP